MSEVEAVTVPGRRIPRLLVCYRSAGTNQSVRDAMIAGNILALISIKPNISFLKMNGFFFLERDRDNKNTITQRGKKIK